MRYTGRLLKLRLLWMERRVTKSPVFFVRYPISQHQLEPFIPVLQKGKVCLVQFPKVLIDGWSLSRTV